MGRGWVKGFNAGPLLTVVVLSRVAKGYSSKRKINFTNR